MFRWLIVLAILAAGSPAHAQCASEDTGALPNNACLQWPRVKIADADGNLDEPGDPEEFRFRLNAAACECSRQAKLGATGVDTDLYYELTLTTSIGQSLPGQVLAGSSCQTDATTRGLQCHEITSAAIADVDTLSQLGEHLIRVPLYDLINASSDLQMLDEMGKPQACRIANAGTAQVWVMVDTDNNGDPDFFSPRNIDLGKFPQDVNGFDTQPPPPLENLRATGSEGSIEITWELPAANQDDFFGFQAFCADDTGAPVGGGSSPGALFSTTQTVCGLPFTLAYTPVTLDAPDESAATLPAEFGSLDTSFICGTTETATATSLRIDGLENNRKYTVALVAVDRYGNPTGSFFDKTVTPKPVTDLWEDIHDRGGKVEGGFCSSGGSGVGLLVPLGFVALWWRRRRRLPALALAAGIALVPSLSRADDFTPYWEDPSGTTESGAAIYEDQVKWHAGIKIGPYTPDIDGQLGADPVTGIGPYQAMFGNYYTEDEMGNLKAHDAHVYQILPMIDVDRVIWSLTGQLAVGGTVGYMQKTALAYKDGTSPSDPFRPRSTASENKFRLIPFALTATYRATQLDDLYGIPLVPYLRGGLAYYVWWMKGPSGDTSEICKDGSSNTADCGDTNKARGGTLGFTGSLGLSIRAERIDRDAARSMKQSGIYHAGFYAELMGAFVSGFGSDKKLSVGDKTWFAGFDFEF